MRELGPANENVDKNYYFKNLSNTWKIRIVELSKSERKLELEKKLWIRFCFGQTRL